MKASVRWQGDLSFKGTADSGFEVPLGAGPEVGGDDDGFRPLELMALSLAGCTGMDVISILEKKRQEITAYEVKVDAVRAEEHPKVFTEAKVAYHITGKEVSEKAVVRSIELSATQYCPAQGMLDQLMPIQLLYYIYEDQGDGKKELVSEGEYITPEQGT
ncbi:MAG: OsmC family protein [Anaerolineales bacterium]|nr:OsmC family protein [Anaerolineales bacterium]